ncbi:hypothetical protein MAFF301560_40150 (plasmid) [Ralstonia solanacearum]|nr:hypothetical protein MAFF301560_40150 [Ralstonia solanacearum]BEU48668.1 hypothetical protein MAFF211519_39930 [Ralstonia pseudosolanacearum]
MGAGIRHMRHRRHDHDLAHLEHVDAEQFPLAALRFAQAKQQQLEAIVVRQIGPFINFLLRHRLPPVARYVAVNGMEARNLKPFLNVRTAASRPAIRRVRPVDRDRSMPRPLVPSRLAECGPSASITESDDLPLPRDCETLGIPTTASVSIRHPGLATWAIGMATVTDAGA